VRLPGFLHHRVTVPGRHPHERLRRRRLRPTGKLVALLAIVGPGILAGLSDDDPPGITTYSVLGADYGYELIWVLTLSTVALIVFHEVAARTGIVTGKGLLALIRDERGPTAAAVVAGALLVANFGTLAAEFAGLAAGAELLTGAGREVAIPIAAVAVAALVLRGNFHRVEHLLLALSSVFAAYLVAGFLAGPDWGETARGAVVPSLPGGRDAIVAVVATIGTTLAPWGLAFIQSYAVDKDLRPSEINFERVDVTLGAVMTGVIGLFVIVTCAATLHAQGIEINDASDAAASLEPLAGSAATSLFGIGFVGAALLAIAVVPLSTAYSLSEARGRPADLDAKVRDDPFFYGAYVVTTGLAAALVMIPGVPIIPLLYLSQALNAVLLLVILPFIRHIAADEAVMGRHRLGRAARAATGLVTVGVAASVITLAALTIG
jgi:Mn2+/Fe2+ NRAMP family transporter